MSWEEYQCKCGLGERHNGYQRSDMAMVTFDHGEAGNQVKETLFCTNGFGEKLPGTYRSFKKPMTAMDKKWPLPKGASR